MIKQYTKQTYTKLNKLMFFFLLLGALNANAQGIGFEEDVDDETEEVGINNYIVLMALSGMIFGLASYKKKVS